MKQDISKSLLNQSKYELHRHLRDTLTPSSIVSQSTMSAYLGDISADELRRMESQGCPVIRRDGKQPRYIVGQVEKWISSFSSYISPDDKMPSSALNAGFQSSTIASLVSSINNRRCNE